MSIKKTIARYGSLVALVAAAYGCGGMDRPERPVDEYDADVAADTEVVPDSEVYDAGIDAIASDADNKLDAETMIDSDAYDAGDAHGDAEAYDGDVLADADAAREVCDGIDNDGDGFTDVIARGTLDYIAVCTDNQNCGTYGNACDIPNTHCEIVPEYPHGALCVCDTGWTACPDSPASCDTHVAADPENCGTCGNACDEEEVCLEGMCRHH